MGQYHSILKALKALKVMNKLYGRYFELILKRWMVIPCEKNKRIMRFLNIGEVG